MSTAANLKATVDIIMAATDAGSMLTPGDFDIVLEVLNDRPLTRDETDRFKEVLRLCRAGEYSKGWYGDIEHLTLDTLGYIRWKDAIVENVEHPYGEVIQLTEIADRCRRLEAMCIDVSPQTVVKYWSWFSDIDADDEYAEMFSHTPLIGIDVCGHVAIVEKGMLYEVDDGNIGITSLSTYDRKVLAGASPVEVMNDLGFTEPNVGQGSRPLSTASGQQLKTWLQQHQVPPLLLG